MDGITQQKNHIQNSTLVKFRSIVFELYEEFLIFPRETRTLVAELAFIQPKNDVK